MQLPFSDYLPKVVQFGVKSIMKLIIIENLVQFSKIQNRFIRAHLVKTIQIQASENSSFSGMRFARGEISQEKISQNPLGNRTNN